LSLGQGLQAGCHTVPIENRKQVKHQVRSTRAATPSMRRSQELGARS
jgi:hypothetical protein